MNNNLRSNLIRLAHANPHMRADILPLLAQGKQASAKQAHGPVALPDPDVMLYYIDKAANSSKFYEMKVVKSGMGYLLKKRWGRLTDSGASGRVDSKDEPFADLRTAQMAMLAHKVEKTRKGYKEADGQYPIGLGAAGFGWGGQAACAFVPELKQLASMVSKAKVDLGGMAPTLAALDRRNSGMAKQISGLYEGTLSAIDKLDTYLEKQLSAC